MRTTAEERLMRIMEEMVQAASRKMSRSEFRKVAKDAHSRSMKVIRKHRRLIHIWTQMDRRMSARAKKALKRKEWK